MADSVGRGWKTTDNAGKSTAIGFDSAGRRAYLAENHVNFSLDANETGIGGGGANDQDRVTKFTYNDLGVLKEQTALDANTAKNQTTRYVYAFELGDKGCPIHRPELLRGIIFPDSDANVSGGIGAGTFSNTDHVTYTYYCNGARATATDQRGVVRTYTYDGLGRLTADAATVPGAPTYSIDSAVLRIGRAYDPNGAVASVTSYDANSGGNTVNEIRYTRDAWGNVTRSIQDPNGPAADTDPNVAYTWGYGLSGSAATYARLEKITLPGGRQVYYNYEDVNAFMSLGRVGDIADGSSGGRTKYVAYKYLGASTVVDANHPAVPGGLRLTYDPNANKAYDGFDRFGRTIDQRWARTDAADPNVDRFTYTYDRAGNRLTRSLPLKTAYNETYEYDFLDRLRDANRPGDSGVGGLDQSWTLDPVGNWASFISDGVTQTRTHNNANEITAITRSPGDLPDPLYGPAGCNVFGPKPNDDANGMHSRYDAWNRLATVHLDDGDTAGTLDANDTLLATYRYDGLNRRVRKIVVNDDANTTTEHIYHNTDWQVLEVRRGLDGAAPAATAYKQYAWDIRYIDAPICRWWDADSDGQADPNAGEMHYYTNDGNFNTTALIDANSGSVVERYMYDPYGKPTFLDANWTPIPASAHENEVLYCGYRYDPETGKYHLRNRYLDWLTGRLDSRDKSGYVDGASLYEYVKGSPSTRVDPYGRQSLRGALRSASPALRRLDDEAERSRQARIDSEGWWAVKESLEMPGSYGMFKAKVWEYTNSKSSNKSSCVMYVDVNVKFVFGQRGNEGFTAGGWKKEEKTKYTSEWDSAVKKVWSQRVRLELMEGSRSGGSACKCPCGTDVVIKTRIDSSGTPGARESGQWIVRVVKEKTGASQAGSGEMWLYEGDNRPHGEKGQVTSAHEFGHVLGLLDEYEGAPVRAKSAALNEKNNIMWSGLDVRPQQYVIFSEILNEKLGKGNGCKYGVRDAEGKWFTKDNAGLDAGWVMGVPK